MFFLGILFALYLIPSGGFYLFFMVWRRKSWESQRVSKSLFRPADVRRDLGWSFLSVAIFALLAIPLYQAVKAGQTRMYFDFQEYGILYLVLSFFLCLLIFDTYHYWFHRFMHIKAVFPYFHKVHHLSVAPTPWSTFAFGPLEALVQFAVHPLILFVLPLHPAPYLLFVFYVMAINAGGHLGIEFTPAGWGRNVLLKYNNRVSHHDLHHHNWRYNFGTCFNIWDRIAGTFKDVTD